MIYPIITFFITILLGPGMFWFFSHVIYKKSNLKKYPTQINDKYGDLIFLPVFNAIFVELIIKINHIINYNYLIISIFLSIIFTLIYVKYQINANYLDWSKPKKDKLNLGGIYHSCYILIQTTIILYGIILFYNNYLIYIGVIGYLITTLIQYIKKGYI
ncbi:MAG: hypothetical protein ACLFPJ_01485 [Candidatus Woesearchaeota archaeon]